MDGYVVQRQRDVRLGNWENIDLVYGWEVLCLSAVVVHFNGWEPEKASHGLSGTCHNNNNNNIESHAPPPPPLSLSLHAEFQLSSLLLLLAGSPSWLLGV